MSKTHKQNTQSTTRNNNLWVGMITLEKKNTEKKAQLSYRMKVMERDQRKLEREEWK